MKRSAKFAVRVIAPVILIAALGGCASEEGWQPTVDIARDPHKAELNRDLYQCRKLAMHAANQTKSVAEGTGIGALGGAAGGALIGAVVGAPATGAAIGAASGAGLGLGGSALGSNATFKHAYIHCMRERGHPVVD
jgi:hypothetical protein